jgi:hypothetical protein
MWGGTRKGDGKFVANAIDKNMRLISSRYSNLLRVYSPTEERYLP